MKNTIEVNGINLYAFHGHLIEENKIGGHYTIDVSVTTDFSAAGRTDDLTDTINYVDINTIVCEEMAIPSKLIEHVCYRIINRLKAEVEGVETVRVKVIKHAPPMEGVVENVAVIVEG